MFKNDYLVSDKELQMDSQDVFLENIVQEFADRVKKLFAEGDEVVAEIDNIFKEFIKDKNEQKS